MKRLINADKQVNEELDEEVQEERSSRPPTSPPPVRTYGSLNRNPADPRSVPLLELSRNASYLPIEDKYRGNESDEDNDTESKIPSTDHVIDIEMRFAPRSLFHNIDSTPDEDSETKVLSVPHFPPLVLPPPHVIPDSKAIQNALIYSWINNEPLRPVSANLLSSLSERDAVTVEYTAFKALLANSDAAIDLIRQTETEEKRRLESLWCPTRWFCTSSSPLYQKGLLITGLMFVAGVGIAGGLLWNWTHNFDPTAFPDTTGFNDLNENVATTLKDLDHMINIVWPIRIFMVVGGALGVGSLLLYHIIKACHLEPREKMENKFHTDFKSVQSKLKAGMDVLQRQESIIDLNESKLNQGTEHIERLMRYAQSLFKRIEALEKQVDSRQFPESKSFTATETPPPPPPISDMPTVGYGARNMRQAMTKVSLTNPKGTPGTGSKASSNSSSVFNSSSSSSSSFSSSSSNRISFGTTSNPLTTIRR